LTTLASDTAYHSFAGEVEARTPPRYAAFFPSGRHQLSRIAQAFPMIKVAMDESGVHDNSPVLTVSAYAARPRQWQEWTKRWKVVKRSIKVFHSVDCANLTGEFRGSTPEQRDPLAIRLLDVLRDSDIPGVVIGIHMDEFRKAMSGHDDLRALFGSPYAACVHWVIQTIMNIGIEVGSKARIKFIHESNDYRRDAEEAFAWVEKNGNPSRAKISLEFADKKDYLPLQAADVLAYEGNKRIRDPSRPERRPWQALNPDARILAAHYGRENMDELIDRLAKIRDGKFGEIDLGSSWRRAHFRLDRDVT
jgi:hypothetical protein